MPCTRMHSCTQLIKLTIPVTIQTVTYLVPEVGAELLQAGAPVHLVVDMWGMTQMVGHKALPEQVRWAVASSLFFAPLGGDRARPQGPAGPPACSHRSKLHPGRQLVEDNALMEHINVTIAIACNAAID